MTIIGFTYDLRDDYLARGLSHEETAEFDSIETIEEIELALCANGYKVERIGNIHSLVTALAVGKRWEMVFNICEGVKGIGRESQVPCLLEAYDIPTVFSPSEVMTLTMNKAWAKMVVREKGIPTAPFHVIKDIADLASFDLPFPVFAKPIAEGTGKGITERSLVKNKQDLDKLCADLLETYQQPVLVETYLTGEDLTVGLLGSGESARTIAVMRTIYKDGAEKAGQTLYNKENWKKVLEYELVDGPLAERASDIALKSWRALGCLDGGRLDLRCDANGVPYFIEVNPLAGLRPHYSDLPMLAEKSGMSYNALIGHIMDEAFKRYNKGSMSLSKTVVRS